MSGHPSTEMLARYAEGDLDTRRARRIDDHLGGCPGCSSVLAELSQVSDLLAGAPPPLPPAIAARLDAVLAAAVAERATVAGSGEKDREPAPMIPGRSGPRGRRSRQPGRGAWRSSPLLLRGLAAAGAVVVLAGGGLLFSRFSVVSSSSGAVSSAAVPGGGAQHAAGTMAGKNGAAAAAPSTAAPAFGAGPGFWQFTYSRDGVAATTTLFVSGLNLGDLGPATLRAEVQRTLTARAEKSDQGKWPAGASSAPPRPAPGEYAVMTLPACVSRIAAGSEIRLIETARYQGVPVAIIVSASSPSASALDVTVVGTGCSASTSDVLARTVVPAGN